MFCHTVTGVEKMVTVTKPGCKAEEFECRPGNCIPGKWKCDGQKVKHILVLCTGFDTVGSGNV
jgi:hypothetical protein